MPNTYGRFATLALTAALGAAALSAGPAAASGGDDDTAPTCTLSAEQVTTLQDELALLKEQFKGHKPTAAEREAFNAAVRELEKAAQDAKLSRADRDAKRAEHKALARKLSDATSAEERAAIRAEMGAIQLRLDEGKLTEAEKKEIRTKRDALKRSLKGQLSKAEKKAVQDRMKVVHRQLEPCVSDDDTEDGDD